RLAICTSPKLLTSFVKRVLRCPDAEDKKPNHVWFRDSGQHRTQFEQQSPQVVCPFWHGRRKLFRIF
ncbi:MAG: hypothetical protein WCK15_02650, partial [Pirellula sp.]